jgi:hypothetical protein
MRASRLSLQRFRTERREMVRQYVGQHWSDEGSREKVPVNLISLYLQIVSRNLIAKNPRVLLSTFQRQHQPMVNAMQTWANKEITRLDLSMTLQRVVLDALFSFGICKVALSTPADSANLQWNLKAGEPFAARVDLDDFVCDMHARDFSEVSFIGHRYRVPLEVVRESKEYTKERKNLAASTDEPYNLEGDERISHMGRGHHAGSGEEYEELVDLWEVYLPRHRCVVTLANDAFTGAATVGAGGAGKALRYQDWLGPETGPYKILPLLVVPGNVIPKGPIQDLIDLHNFANQSFRKLMRKTQDQKDIAAVQGGASQDGSRIQEANDGDIIRVDNPEKIASLSFNGPNAQVHAMFEQTRSLFNFLGGNLELMGGLSPQAKTAKQDAMLEQNASRAIADMQDRCISFASDVLGSMCWYWWHDPFKVMQSTYNVPGLPEIKINREVTPERRGKAKWSDLEVKVDPYSMQHQTPQTKLQFINTVVQQIVMPMAPLLQQQGIGLDLNRYLTMIAELGDMPELTELLTVQDMPQEQAQAQEEPGMPAVTSRNYTRENMPGRTERGDAQNRINTLMNVDPGGSQNGAAAMNGAMS